ncbi:N-acetyltransferase [Arenibaculum sp.]|jgi:putative acetyltransferase|uniref:GNAT family N-acetyltransferase n=1 Tax=Arenibaculum sp. TaxID=2865862 RepID=UPI002E12657D|nr:N-acetyltransferase [Arenibaculum sp.]
MRIEEETQALAARIRAVLAAAFGGGNEADLVERLRADGLVRLALVALEDGEAEDGEVVGHVVFSDLAVEVDGRKVDAVALAPVAVRPDRQRRGTGAALIRAGLERLRRDGCEAVVVLGHPRYYPRFGFSPALARKLAAPFAGDAFMALELAEGALAGAAGSVRYPDAFGIAG